MFYDISSSSDNSNTDSSDSDIDIVGNKEEEKELFNHLCSKFGFDYNGIIKSSFSCTHYMNRCSVICNKCPETDNKFGCYKCHNIHIEQKNINDIHELINTDIKLIECIKYNTRQTFRKRCIKCNTLFGKYICIKCKIIDNRTDIKYFHCNKCRCCFVGDRKDYRHCNNCFKCVLKTDFKKHICDSNNSIEDMNCSICYDSIKSHTSYIMRCGHILHHDCYTFLIKDNYKCPVCRKTIKDMTELFRQMEIDINLTPLSIELQKTIDIRCNDCSLISNTNYHYIGNKCIHCNSFNTYEIYSEN